MVRDKIGQYGYPIHRHDKPTSGVLLFALSKEIARMMTDIFKARETKKEYLAIVRGYTVEHELIDYPLKEQLDKMTDAKANQDKEAQPAVTEYERLGTVEIPYAVGRYPVARYSLLKLRPKTGRKHQIRRHMKHIFHPIVGDTTHGRTEHNNLFRAKLDCHRLLLHASSLGFKHPVNKEQITIAAPLDETFIKIVNKFGWQEILLKFID